MSPIAPDGDQKGWDNFLSNCQRIFDEYGGKWAMAKYIEAVETEDTNIKEEIIDKILKYNEEDLAATWAVFQWLKKEKSQ